MEETTRKISAPPNFPTEMVEEILSRLPVKSLSRFKCVCSSWRSLISESLFALKHALFLEASKATTCNKSQYGVITTSRYHLKSCCVHSLYNESNVNVVEHDGTLLGRDYYQVVGTCNGLVCFLPGDYDKSLYLWNPTTNLRQRLSGLDLEVVVTYGFGYDESEDDYKVVALLQQRQNTQVAIYSRRQNLWRRRSNNNYTCFPSGVVIADRSRSGIYTNGTLNWAAIVSSSSSTAWTIVSYDLSRDAFKEHQGPACCRRGCFTMTLGDLRGRLSMVCYCEGANAADVWVMREFGEGGESWSKVVSIPGLTEFVRPLWISDELVVLLEFRSGLALYNCVNGRFQYPVSDSLSSCRDAKVYVKTLVSPNDL